MGLDHDSSTLSTRVVSGHGFLATRSWPASGPGRTETRSQLLWPGARFPPHVRRERRDAALTRSDSDHDGPGCRRIPSLMALPSRLGGPGAGPLAGRRLQVRRVRSAAVRIRHAPNRQNCQSRRSWAAAARPISGGSIGPVNSSYGSHGTRTLPANKSERTRI